jgi:hypothetical protein
MTDDDNELESAADESFHHRPQSICRLATRDKKTFSAKRNTPFARVAT